MTEHAMRTGAIVYGETEAHFAWVDLAAGRVLNRLPLPSSPVVEVFPELDLLLVSYEDYFDDDLEDRLDVYRLSSWELRKSLGVERRAHFNIAPSWSTFLPSRDGRSIWTYQSEGLGDHLGADYIAALDVETLAWRGEPRRIPECIAGWSVCSPHAEAQMLYISDGLEVGELPKLPPPERVVFWDGPEGGFSEPLALGPRPRAHSDLGHARAILAARERPLSVVVRTNGELFLIDSAARQPLERQRAALPEGCGMPIFGAHLDPAGRRVYIGAASPELRATGGTETVVVHDLEAGRTQETWRLDTPLRHTALSADGCTLFGAVADADEIVGLDVETGKTVGAVSLGGEAYYLTAA